MRIGPQHNHYCNAAEERYCWNPFQNDFFHLKNNKNMTANQNPPSVNELEHLKQQLA